ncbi:endonuclease III [Desulfovibrio ferrophilus]|uniref:Endonuclease III n=1 Tax=Desulfovibrio ferrophilus TaxID=241368 RepID=A0A2Z6AYP2_9BACT|nr:endonuclease III [Desulfovibrio ferrophilus]BBD08381.1 endonuclease III [Desulfovibrio ferrophilus]
MKRQARALEILSRLKNRYPAPQSELDWTTPWELLAATMLSAQCTDVRVNKVTPELFRRWPDPPAMAQADPAEVEKVIHSAGFFRQKTKNLIGEATIIINDYDGEVPRTMKDLTRLPGVARKTANIVLSNAFGIQEGVAVDTHVKRLAFRMGLTTSTDVKKIEQDLMKLFPKPDWGDANHMLVLFGRHVCPARTPRCNDCEMNDICPKRGVKTK